MSVRRSASGRAFVGRRGNALLDHRPQRPPVERVLFDHDCGGPHRALGNPIAESFQLLGGKRLAVLGHLGFVARDDVEQPALLRLSGDDDGCAVRACRQALG
jgi:hypothetical protein